MPYTPFFPTLTPIHPTTDHSNLYPTNPALHTNEVGPTRVIKLRFVDGEDEAVKAEVNTIEDVIAHVLDAANHRPNAINNHVDGQGFPIAGAAHARELG